MIQLQDGDIIWHGKDESRIFGRTIPYHIIFSHYTDSDGCWCPLEGISFFKNLGIIPVKSNYYSGFSLPGCWWQRGEKSLSLHVQEEFNRFLDHQFTNRSAMIFLQK